MTSRAVNGHAPSHTPTIIGLLVGSTPQDHNRAQRYVQNLPDSAVLYTFCEGPMRRTLRAEARERRVAFASCETPYDTVRMAQMVVIIGDSPLKRAEMNALEDQGIPVEWKIGDTTQRRA